LAGLPPPPPQEKARSAGTRRTVGRIVDENNRYVSGRETRGAAPFSRVAEALGGFDLRKRVSAFRALRKFHPFVGYSLFPGCPFVISVSPEPSEWTLEMLNSRVSGNVRRWK